jgi:hypothetical protein
MYHNPFDILDPMKEVYRINLAELGELINQDHATRWGAADPQDFNPSNHFTAIACGHDLATMDIPISTIALVYGIDTGMLAIKKAKRVDGTPVKFSPKLCQKFIVDQLSLWQHQVFSGAAPNKPTELMQLLNIKENECELYFAMIRATTTAHDKKLDGDDFYQYVINNLLAQFKIAHDLAVTEANAEHPTDMENRDYHINRHADWQTSQLAFWFHELERLQSPDAELPDFQELLGALVEVFNYPIDCLLEEDGTYASPNVQTLVHFQKAMTKQFIDQMQGIFFWTHVPATIAFQG